VQLEHHLSVPAPIDVVRPALLDPERVALCVPGATLTGVDGDSFTGTVKVKVESGTGNCLQPTKCRGMQCGRGRVQMERFSFSLLPATRPRPRPCSGVRSPLSSAHTIIVDPKVPRTDEVLSTPQAHRFVSVLGAAWLLMGQPNVAETSTFTDTSPPPRPRGDASTQSSPRERQPVTVTIVDLRGAHSGGKRGSGRRTQQERTWVAWPGGYWRQQAFGPGHSLRKPKWIGPYTKGPEGAPLAAPKPRVNVLRG
jgi:hypothetical protein